MSRSSSQSPRAQRSSTNDAEAYAKGDVNIDIRPISRNGAPEYRGLPDGSRLRIEDTNSRASRPRRKA
jgi:hypothetical protein